MSSVPMRQGAGSAGRRGLTRTRSQDQRTRSLHTGLKRTAGKGRGERYKLRLHVVDLTPRSLMAVESVTEICEKHLTGRYDLEVIDICEHPELARAEQIVVAPTLIRCRPLPLRRLIGDMASEEKVLSGLGLRPEP